MREWVPTTTHGLPGSDTFGVGTISDNGQPLLEVCSYHGPALPTPTSKRSHSTRCLGVIPAQSIGTNWT